MLCTNSKTQVKTIHSRPQGLGGGKLASWLFAQNTEEVMTKPTKHYIIQGKIGTYWRTEPGEFETSEQADDRITEILGQPRPKCGEIQPDVYRVVKVKRTVLHERGMDEIK
jgi:hypothetical protein